jgi:hypothetical protein
MYFKDLQNVFSLLYMHVLLNLAKPRGSTRIPKDHTDGLLTAKVKFGHFYLIGYSSYSSELITFDTVKQFDKVFLT